MIKQQDSVLLSKRRRNESEDWWLVYGSRAIGVVIRAIDCTFTSSTKYQTIATHRK